MNPVGITDPVAVASQADAYHRLHPELVEQLISIYRTMFPHSDGQAGSAWTDLSEEARLQALKLVT